jgi:hypothetical protein
MCWTRPQIAGRENRCVGEHSWFNSRSIFSCTRRGIALFLARTTFWRGTPAEIIFAAILPRVDTAACDFVQLFLSFSILFLIDLKLRVWQCPRCGRSFFSGAKPTRPLRWLFLPQQCRFLRSLEVCIPSIAHSTRSVMSGITISFNPSPDKALTLLGNWLFPLLPRFWRRLSRHIPVQCVLG